MFACTVIVGQSMMSATITWSPEGSPSCSWESPLGEGSISLMDLIPLSSHLSDHLSCNNQCVGLLSSPLCFFLGVAFFVSCWSVNLISMIHALKISRVVVSVTYSNLGISNLKSCDVRRVGNMTSAVCHGKVCGCVLCGLSEIMMSCFCGGCVYPVV